MADWKWAALLALGAATPINAAPGDQAKIIELQQKQAAAWNVHDIQAYSSLFTADADVVNVLGWHWHSRSELQEKLGARFRIGVQELAHDNRPRVGEVPEAGRCRGACQLDHDRRAQPNGRRSRCTRARYPNSDTRQALRPLAHRSVPEHELGSGEAIPS